MCRRIHEVWAWAILAVYALAGVAPAQDLVICFEPDGTVAVEAAAPGGCKPTCRSDEVRVDAERPEVACCSCTDIHLPTRVEDPQAKLGTASAPQLPPAPAAIPWVDALAIVSPTVPDRSGSDAPRQPPGLARIRTVVLRI